MGLRTRSAWQRNWSGASSTTSNGTRSRGCCPVCDRVQLVDSAAGVGKSTMLRVYDQGMTLAGRHVTYLATTTPAVGVLREDGFAAETVAKFLLSEKMQVAARGGTVVVDESSMLGLRDAYRLFSIAKEKDIKLVFLGDSRQHSSVAAGAFMRLLQEYGGITPTASPRSSGRKTVTIARRSS